MAYSIFFRIVAFLLPFISCQTNITNCPFEIDQSCQCKNGSATEIDITCVTSGEKFPTFPVLNDTFPKYKYSIVLEGDFAELPAYAFKNFQPFSVLLIRNSSNPTTPLTIDDNCFLTYDGKTVGAYGYRVIVFENFLSLTKIPTKALSMDSLGSVDQILFFGCNFSTLENYSFRNVSTEVVVLENCNIETVETETFGDMPIFPNGFYYGIYTLSLANNRLTEVPMLALSRLNDSLKVLDVSGNLLTTLSDIGFENFAYFFNFQFGNNPIEYIPLNAFNNFRGVQLIVQNLPLLTSLDVSITIGMTQINKLNISNCSTLTTLEISNYQLPDSLYNILSPPTVQYINPNFENWFDFETIVPYYFLFITSSQYACDSSMLWMKEFMCSSNGPGLIYTSYEGTGVPAKCSNGQSVLSFVCAGSANFVSILLLFIVSILLALVR